MTGAGVSSTSYRDLAGPPVDPADAWTSAPCTPRWETVCRLDRLEPGRGVAALLGSHQVAVFRVAGLHEGERVETVYAIDNVDPCSGAAVLSRGLVGDRSGEPVVASPLYKQAFSLVSGQCLDEPEYRVAVYPVRLAGPDATWVQVGLR